MGRLPSVADRFHGHDDAIVVIEGVQHGVTDAAARHGAGHDERVHAVIDEVREQIGAHEAARIRLHDHRFVVPGRHLRHDLVCLGQLHDRTVDAPRLPAPALDRPRGALAAGVEDGRAGLTRRVEEARDHPRGIAGAGARERIRGVHEGRVHVHDQEGRAVPEAHPSAPAPILVHLLLGPRNDVVPDRHRRLLPVSRSP